MRLRVLVHLLLDRLADRFDLEEEMFLVERNDMPVCCLIHLLEAIDVLGNGTPQLVVGRSCRAQKQSCDNSAVAWRKDRHVFTKWFFAGAVGSPGVPTDTL